MREREKERDLKKEREKVREKDRDIKREIYQERERERMSDARTSPAYNLLANLDTTTYNFTKFNFKFFNKM